MKFANSVSKRKIIAKTRIIAVNFVYKKTPKSTDNQVHGMTRQFYLKWDSNIVTDPIEIANNINEHITNIGYGTYVS